LFFTYSCLAFFHLSGVARRTRAQEVDNSGTELFEYACPCKVRGRWCASVGVGMSCRRIACNSAFSHSLSSLDQPLPTGWRLLRRHFFNKESSKSLRHKTNKLTVFPQGNEPLVKKQVISLITLVYKIFGSLLLFIWIHCIARYQIFIHSLHLFSIKEDKQLLPNIYCIFTKPAHP